MKRALISESATWTFRRLQFSLEKRKIVEEVVEEETEGKKERGKRRGLISYEVHGQSPVYGKIAASN